MESFQLGFSLCLRESVVIHGAGCLLIAML